jgi:hypothetical protein
MTTTQPPNDPTLRQPPNPSATTEPPDDPTITLEELFAGLDDAELFDYEEQPLLVVDSDPERAVARQREMMDFCFGGIGEEKKPEKRMGLAMQQADIEQRHALRLLLIYQDPAALTAHMERCLADPQYGYGERGDNGRTIAQAMAAMGGGDMSSVAVAWLDANREFQQRVVSGIPFSFRSLFDYSDLDTFVPLVQRVGDTTWRLGLEGQGKHRDFQGAIETAWPHLCDAYVEWCDEDNAAWLNDLKRRVARLPDSIFRAARADRLRKEADRVEVNGSRIVLTTTRGEEQWPRMITLADAEGTPQLGLSRLSGHSFYECSWDGGLHVRRFDMSSTSRKKIPFEHIELATLLAETLGTERGLQAEPSTAEQVEAAYLRRMKAGEAELGPSHLKELSPAIQGQPMAGYRVGDIQVTVLRGGEDVAYATVAGKEEAVLLRKDPQRGVVLALPVTRGRPRRGETLMPTPLAEIKPDSPPDLRALCAWAAWLTQVTVQGKNKVAED